MSDITTQVSSSINALAEEFNIITHNLANVSTTGYKRICNTFSQSLMDQMNSEQAEPSGDVISNITLDFSQGNIVETARPLDFALYGKGFFVIETPDGPLYTRNGTFRLNQNGQIVDGEGRIVAGQAGPITVPPNTGLSQLAVSSNGSISAAGVVIGKFKLVDFQENQDQLESAGKSCFFMQDEDITTASAENIVVKQGYQEASNVKK